MGTQMRKRAGISIKKEYTCGLENSSCQSSSCHTSHGVMFPSQCVNSWINSIVHKGLQHRYQRTWISYNGQIGLTSYASWITDEGTPSCYRVQDTVNSQPSIWDSEGSSSTFAHTPGAADGQACKKRMNMWWNRTIRNLKMDGCRDKER